jgi:Ca2+-binding RTX toxin-like protein
VVLAKKGNDVIHGDNGVDRLYGGKGNDRIYSAGRVSDVVKCGRGNRDWAEVNPSDKVEGCERVVRR